MVLSLFVISCSSTEKASRNTSNNSRLQAPKNFEQPKFANNTKKQILEDLADYSKEYDCKIKERVVVGFLITKESKIEQINYFKLIPNECKQAITRTLNNIDIISPAKRDGNPIDINYRLPMNFR